MGRDGPDSGSKEVEAEREYQEADGEEERDPVDIQQEVDMVPEKDDAPADPFSAVWAPAETA